MFNKNRRRYSDQKAKKLNRDVISYEEVPLDDYEEETTRVSSVDAKKIVKIVILLLILGLIVFAFANRNSLTPENISNWFKYDVLGQGDGKGYPVNIVGTNVDANNMITVGNTISYASDTSFVTLSSNASEIQNYQLSYASPVISNNGNNLLIYSLGGKEFNVGTTNEITYAGKTDDNIFTGDISGSGVYGVVTQTSGYLSKLYIFNKENKQIYAYSFSDYYITSLSINPSGTQCIACGISAKEGSFSGIVYVLDFKQEEPLGTYEINENVIYRSEYFSSNEACLIGDTASYLMSTSDGALTENSYNQMLLTAYEVNENTGNYSISLSRTGDGHSCTVKTFNSSGETVSEIETDYKISALTLQKGDIYILENSNVHCYDFSGNEKRTGDAGSGAKQIKVSSDGTVFVIGVNEIRKSELK